jgi:hypothetical protein
MATVLSASSTTALSLIKRSLRMLGVYSIGEDLSDEEAQDALSALNALMGSLSNGGMVFAKTVDPIALSAGQSSVTVGPTGTAATDRPVRVLSESYVQYGDVSYGLEVYTLQQYNDITLKTVQGIPVALWVQPDVPDVTVTLWPVPNQAMTLYLWSDKLISSFPTLTGTVSLPPCYEEALAYILAETIAPEYEVQVPVAVSKGAARGRRVLKRTNYQVPTLNVDIRSRWADYFRMWV